MCTGVNPAVTGLVCEGCSAAVAGLVRSVEQELQAWSDPSKQQLTLTNSATALLLHTTGATMAGLAIAGAVMGGASIVLAFFPDECRAVGNFVKRCVWELGVFCWRAAVAACQWMALASDYAWQCLKALAGWAKRKFRSFRARFRRFRAQQQQQQQQHAEHVQPLVANALAVATGAAQMQALSARLANQQPVEVVAGEVEAAVAA